MSPTKPETWSCPRSLWAAEARRLPSHQAGMDPEGGAGQHQGGGQPACTQHGTLALAANSCQHSLLSPQQGLKDRAANGSAARMGHTRAWTMSWSLLELPGTCLAGSLPQDLPGIIVASPSACRTPDTSNSTPRSTATHGAEAGGTAPSSHHPCRPSCYKKAHQGKGHTSACQTGHPPPTDSAGAMGSLINGQQGIQKSTCGLRAPLGKRGSCQPRAERGARCPAQSILS